MYICDMGKLRFGLIGCGHIAKRHAEHILREGELVAVCDIDPNKAAAFAHQYNCRSYGQIEDLLHHEETLHVIVICTPNGLHAAQSVLALEAGFHVLCEKPMALTSVDGKRMIEAAKRSDKQLFTIMQNRFNPPVQAVKKAIEEGRLGEIYSIQLSCFWNREAAYYKDSWKGSLDMDGGTLYTQFSHFIDLLIWMIGDINDVQSYMGNYHHKGAIEFEDSGVVILRFEKGAIGTVNYSVNSYDRNMEGSLTILGEKGTVKIGGQYLNELEYQQIKDYTIPPLPRGNPANEYGLYQGSMSNHDKVYANLVDAIKNGSNYFTSPEECLRTVETIERIYRSRKKLL